MTTRLRPLESRVRHLRDAGVSFDEIAWRFRRSPGFIRRVAAMSELERSPRTVADDASLRPVERVVLASAERGLSTAEIAARFRRSPDWVRRVEQFTSYKLSKDGSGTAV